MIVVRDIGEAYYQILKYVHENGDEVPVDVGSYEKELHRIQVPFLACEITHPLEWGWLSDPRLIVSITSDQIEKYFQEYLISADKSENEDYTYGERLLESGQLYTVIQKLQSGFTNQAALTTCKPSDILLKDPPCWRGFSFNVELGGTINLICFARSWDVAGALPLNLSGFAKLLEFVVGFVDGTKVGSLYISAANAHYYSNYKDLIEEYLK